MALGFAQLRERIITDTLGHRNAQPDQLHLAGEPTRLLRARTRALARCVRILVGIVWNLCA
eukprot:9349755-Lingulodinium_polyedra.AAC.1